MAPYGAAVTDVQDETYKSVFVVSTKAILKHQYSQQHMLC